MVALTTGVLAVLAVAAIVGYLLLRPAPATDLAQGEGQDEFTSQPRGVRVASSRPIIEPGGAAPQVVVSVYEDYLCPACGNFERTFGPTLTTLIDDGTIAVDYYAVAILDGSGTRNYSSRAGAAAYCVADESTDAFRRFHAALFTAQLQPDEMAAEFPDDARLIALARQAGAGDDAAACIDSGKYLTMVKGMARATDLVGTPTVRINGADYPPSTPDALVAAIDDAGDTAPA